MSPQTRTELEPHSCFQQPHLAQEAKKKGLTLLPLPWGCGQERTEQLVPKGTRWDWRLGRELKRRDRGLTRRKTPIPTEGASSSQLCGGVEPLVGHLQRWKEEKRECASPGRPVCNLCLCHVYGLRQKDLSCICYPFVAPNNTQKGAVGKATCRACA